MSRWLLFAVAVDFLGFCSIVVIVILFAVLLLTENLYFYKTVLVKDIAGMQNTLTLAQSRFEPFKISELQILDKRLIARDRNFRESCRDYSDFHRFAKCYDGNRSLYQIQL